MKRLIILCTFFICLKLVGQNNLFLVLYSPKSEVELTLKGNQFTIIKPSCFTDSIIDLAPRITGSFTMVGDTVILLSKTKDTFKLIKESIEVFRPLEIDFVKSGDDFYAWEVLYNSRITKQTGGWTKEGEKSGVWQFFDTNGVLIKKRLYENGILIDDDFKYSWEE